MKSILISDHAKWCALMMNGNKTIEVRKGTALYKATQKLIDQYGYADIYVYCTKDEKNLLHKNCVDIYWVEDKDFKAKSKKLGIETQPYLNGKVIFKFRCYNVEEIIPFYDRDGEYDSGYFTETLSVDEFKKVSCIDTDDLADYLDEDYKKGYAIHISDLEIFDRPRELCEFHTNVKKEPPEELLCPECGKPMEYYEYKYLTKAPQSWCYIEVE